MRDSDASALSLTRRQYLQLKALLDFLGAPGRAAAGSAEGVPAARRGR